MLLFAEFENSTSGVPDTGEWFKLFGQIAKNLKGNNLFLFGQGLVLVFGVIFIPLWLKGVLAEQYIVLIVCLLFGFMFLSSIVVMFDIQSKNTKKR